jgi:hypothetical protein
VRHSGGQTAGRVKSEIAAGLGYSSWCSWKYFWLDHRHQRGGETRPAHLRRCACPLWASCAKPHGTNVSDLRRLIGLDLTSSLRSPRSHC